MVIIVRNDEAVMFFTDSQFSDATGLMHGSGFAGVGYTVPNIVKNTHNILGISSSIDDVTGITLNDGQEPMTHNEVASLAIGSSFAILA
jgi:hypothetical protein